MNEAIMDYPVVEDEIEYTEEEIEAIYADYQQRVLKKNDLKMWCRRFLK